MSRCRDCFTWGLMMLMAFAFQARAQQSAATCNTFAPLTSPTFGNLSVTSSQIPVFGGDQFANKGRVIDNDLTNTAAYSFLVAGSAYLEVKDNNATGANLYPAGTFAGFVVSDNTILSAFGTTTITTYEGNTLQETSTTGSLLATGIASGQAQLGFITTKPFDRIRVTFSALGAGTVSVYYAVVQRYCASQTLACNTPTPVNNPAFAVAVSPANTGVSGVNVGSISNANNAVSNDNTDFASVNIIANVGTASFAIKDQVTDYPAGTFAGLDISRSGLLSVGALSDLTISTYLNGVATGQSVSGSSLLAVGSSILNGTGRQTVGFVATQPFDEIKLTFSGVTIGVTNIYGAVFQRFCAGTQLACNVLTPVANPAQPVYVDGRNTGIDATLCAACSINNSQNAIDSDPSNFASIELTAGVATSASFAVANAIDTYAVNSFAGFDIETNSLLNANALSTATISLYNNGALVQTGTGNALIVGATTGLQDGRSRQIVGIVANVAYDEVKVTFAQVASANLGSVRIYSAVLENTCTTSIVCNTAYNLSSPAFPAVIDGARTGVSGAVGVTLSSANVLNAQNVISASTTDFARITNTASVAAVTSIAVLDPVNTFPVGTFAGFTIRRVNGLVAADLFDQLTVTTYLDGVQQEVRSGRGALLDLSVALFGSTSGFVNVGFATTKAFDEIQLSVAPLVGLGVLGGGLDVFGAFIDTRTSTGGSLVCALNTNPDFTVTNINVPVSGNVRTNDNVPAGTTYGPAATLISQPGGSTPTLTLNNDGSFNFTSATAGVYVYSIPVCPAGTTTGCQTQTLTVTVLNPTVTTNNPVANPDFATITGAATNPTPVTLDVTANDLPGNTGGSLGTPTIAAGPANGSASINGGGNLVYTPAAGFVGTDVVTYQVCETPGGLCATATVTIRVNAAGSPAVVSINDDYVSTPNGTPATGNLLDNDLGTGLTVSNPGTTVTSSGTLVTTSTGTFSFTAAPGTTGPATFTYTACDNASNCGTATLHVLVGQPVTPAPVLLTNPDFTVTNINVPVSGNVRTNDNVPAGTTYGPAATLISQPGGSTPTLTLNNDGSFNFTSATAGVYVYSIPVCPAGTTTGCQTQTLTVTVLNPTVTTNNPVANPDFATITGAATNPTPVTLDVTANDLPGNTGGTLGTPTIAAGPANGTASINGSGNLVYTPTAGFVGTDVVTYQVCETPGGLCATATVTIRVNAAGSPAVVSINDDYVSTPNATSSTGNLLDNDLGTGLTVSNPGTTVTSSGTLVTTASGSFTFTPAAGVSGPATFTYTACDNASNCGTATLHVLVGQPLPDLTPTIELPSNNFTVSGAESVKNFTVRIEEVAGGQTASGNIVFTITAPFGYSLAFDNSLTNTAVSGGGNVPVDNTKWTVTSNNGLQLTLKINAGQFIPARGNSNIGFTITRTVTNSGTTSNITVNVADDASKTYDSKPENNIYSRNINAL
ncbi:Ig-like domain-containing protein [Spirosoma sp. RP8]|uniref:Ig-like domain-containing protein n=1 Tax=Spirosoma liriopis TaxID=2937440 RepID=A0ABT0HN74_9BACT|nr:Ig-like domain-containing protein [Spirosoma liriopis]MCK8493622.1 Ig-like domain-containing protein [Spirosoma liriopis]